VKIFTKNLQEAKGFTLVELMVVVAIVGVLSAVAIPNFKTYQAKAKTTEAKLQLGAIYTAENAFFSEFDNYATCLSVMGFAPSGSSADRYYSIGFQTGQQLLGPAGSNCDTAALAAGGNVSNFEGRKNYPTTGAGNAASFLGAIPSVIGASDVFQAGAIGVVSPSNKVIGDADSWSINQDKFVAHEQTGY